MKKRLCILFAFLLSICLVLASCGKTDGGGGTEEKEDVGSSEEKENLIYNKNSELYLINAVSTESEMITEFINAIDSHKSVDALVKFDSVESEPHKHEIVLGSTSRKVTLDAYRYLDRLETNKDTDVRYLIYSDGSSVAMVFDESDGNVAMKVALDIFIGKYISSELVLAKGVIEEGVIDIYEYYEKLDAEYNQKIWDAMAAKVGGQTGVELVEAMKQFYSLYSNDMVLWLANLYEPSICVCNGLYGESECQNTKYCGTAAFYYSNSARDTIGYLPDVESTYQALGLLNSTGITRSYGSTWSNMLDDDMKEAILAFVRAIQREDGYFVHPQWPSPGNSRISRDLNWSVNILNNLNAKPYYTTPTGIKGIGAPSSASALSGRLSSSDAAFAAKVVAVDQAYLPHLENVETFYKYLVGLNIKTNSYSAGNTLAAQASQISARDKALGISGTENSLYSTMIRYLNETQNPENGTWDYKKPGEDGYDLYFQVNGLMKISGVYGSSRPLQYVDEACETAIAAITFAKDIGAAVDIYNPWFALTNIFNNLKGCGGEEGRAKIAEIRERLYEAAPELLIATRNKIAICQKTDGSFSYSPKYSSATSQGAPAAVPNSVEGDVNGTVLSCSGLLDYVYSALGLSGTTKAPLFGDVERVMFMNEIRALKHFDKPNTNTVVDVEGFEDYYPDETPENDSYFSSKLYNTDGCIKVVERDDGQGNALLIDSKFYSGYGDYVYIKNQTSAAALTTFVFEGDFRLDSSDKKYAVQIIMGTAYMFTFRVIGDEVRIYESSSASSAVSVDNDLGVSIPLSQWFGVRVEYYYGAHDEVRIKFYFDSDPSDDNEAELIAVTDNYYDKSGTKIKNPTGTPSKTFGETQIYVLSDAEVSMMIDNVASYKTSDKYAKAEDPEGKLLTNVDADAKSPIVYDFESGELHENITAVGSDYEISDLDGGKALGISSPTASQSFKLPVNLVNAGGRCTTVSFDILCEGATVGDTVMTIVGGDEFGKVAGYALVATKDGSETYLTLNEYVGSLGNSISDARIPLGKLTNLKIEYYSDYRASLFYIDGEFMGASSALYSGGNRRYLKEFDITFNSKSYSLQLDNLVADRVSKSYLDAVKPDVESEIKDFENVQSSDLEGSNCSVVAFGGSMMAKLDSNKSTSELIIPLHERSKISSAYVAELDILYQTAKADGIAHTVSVVNTDGAVIFGITLVINGDELEIYEMSRSGEAKMLVATAKYAKTNKIGFEVYPEKKSAYIYVNGICVDLTGNFAYPENLSTDAISLVIKSGAVKSVAMIDNVKAESLYQVFEKKTVTSLPNAETECPLTFEMSNSASLPERLHKSLVGSGSSIRVENVYNEIMGEYSNAVVLNTKAGNNDKIGLKPVGTEDLSSYSCVTFETDFKMDIFGGDSHKFWFYFSRNAEDTKDIIYQVSFSVSGGKLYFFDRSAPKGYIEKKFYTDKTLDDWHRLKIEYYAGDKDTARIRLFLDGELIYVSDNYSGRTNDSSSPASKTGVKRVYFYSFANTDCDLYLDNMSLTGSDATCSDTVGEK